MDLPPRLAKAEAVPKRLLSDQPGPILIKAHLVDNDGTPVDDASVKAVLRKTGLDDIEVPLPRSDEEERVTHIGA